MRFVRAADYSICHLFFSFKWCNHVQLGWVGELEERVTWLISESMIRTSATLHGQLLFDSSLNCRLKTRCFKMDLCKGWQSLLWNAGHKIRLLARGALFRLPTCPIQIIRHLRLVWCGRASDFRMRFGNQEICRQDWTRFRVVLCSMSDSIRFWE